MRVEHFAGHSNDTCKMSELFIKQCLAQTAYQHQHRDHFRFIVQCTVIKNDRSDACFSYICNDRIDKLVQTCLEIGNIGSIISFCLVGRIILFIVLVTELLKDGKLFRRHDRQNGLETFCMFRIIRKDIADRSEAGIQAHHCFFTNRVNRRVGDLRKFLLEKVCKVSLFCRECRNRRIVTHGCRCLFAFCDHRLDHFSHYFKCIVEVALFCLHFLVVGRRFFHFCRRDMLLQITHIF
ncbi:hypothetical protein MNB_SV-10-239 [hydrothermal vent metagenome]|uniref:Uncharacterized protein n=1 Tax=hydrothermal vent metagenome TaxID=652676 RepID=A0A1W1CJ63_9ZZZZ